MNNETQDSTAQNDAIIATVREGADKLKVLLAQEVTKPDAPRRLSILGLTALNYASDIVQTMARVSCDKSRAGYNDEVADAALLAAKAALDAMTAIIATFDAITATQVTA